MFSLLFKKKKQNKNNPYWEFQFGEDEPIQTKINNSLIYYIIIYVIIYIMIIYILIYILMYIIYII